MGKHCKLCKTEAVKGGQRSFHRFPDPQYQREAWCQVLKLDIKTLKNWSFVCSDHFPLECFLYRSNGQRCLKDDVVPLPYKGQLRKIGRRKKSCRKMMIEEVVIKTEIKTECEEENKPNAVRDIKMEKPDYLVQNEEYSSQDDCPDISVKIEVITKEECDFNYDTFDLKIEEAVNKESEDLNVNTNFQRKGIAENPEFNNWMKGDGDEEKEDIIPRLFKLAYPELKASDLYYCKECSFQTTFGQNLRKHFIIHREAEFRNGLTVPNVHIKRTIKSTFWNTRRKDT